MSKLSAEDRRELPKSKFAGPGRSFPVEDRSHQEAALRDAPKAEHAGHITEEEAEHIKAIARRLLAGEKKK